jgi:hypothetical protein
MSSQIPPTASYLTEIFRRSGALNDGRVLERVLMAVEDLGCREFVDQ